MMFRNLLANEIDVRVGSVSKATNGTIRGISLLLYKDARCDMQILDETVGNADWQRKHYEQKGNLFCSVGIKFENEWVWKDDCGAESYTDKEKGEASDSFKRACVNWGIGRELYTAPFIWLNIGNFVTNANKDKVTDSFKVTHISYKQGKINALSIYSNKLNKNVFEWEDTSTEQFMGDSHIKTILTYCKEFGTNENKVCEKYHIKSIKDMSYEQFIDCCNGFEKAKEHDKNQF